VRCYLLTVACGGSKNAVLLKVLNVKARIRDVCKRRIFECGARVCDPQRFDLQPGVLRLTEPRSTFEEESMRL
jgi:hypothetical protein